jgi:hypothetical protein
MIKIILILSFYLLIFCSGRKNNHRDRIPGDIVIAFSKEHFTKQIEKYIMEEFGESFNLSVDELHQSNDNNLMTYFDIVVEIEGVNKVEVSFNSDEEVSFVLKETKGTFSSRSKGKTKKGKKRNKNCVEKNDSVSYEIEHEYCGHLEVSIINGEVKMKASHDLSVVKLFSNNIEEPNRVLAQSINGLLQAYYIKRFNDKVDQAFNMNPLSHLELIDHVYSDKIQIYSLYCLDHIILIQLKLRLYFNKTNSHAIDILHYFNIFKGDNYPSFNAVFHKSTLIPIDINQEFNGLELGDFVKDIADSSKATTTSEVLHDYLYFENPNPQNNYCLSQNYPQNLNISPFLRALETHPFISQNHSFKIFLSEDFVNAILELYFRINFNFKFRGKLMNSSYTYQCFYVDAPRVQFTPNLAFLNPLNNTDGLIKFALSLKCPVEFTDRDAQSQVSFTAHVSNLTLTTAIRMQERQIFLDIVEVQFKKFEIAKEVVDQKKRAFLQSAMIQELNNCNLIKIASNPNFQILVQNQYIQLLF